MRTAVVAVAGLALAGCVGTSDTKQARGPGQDMYGRTYLQPDRIDPPPEATMTAAPAPQVGRGTAP